MLHNIKRNKVRDLQRLICILEPIGGGLEVSESVCADKLVTFGRLISRMLYENCYIIHKLVGCQKGVLITTTPPMRSRNLNQTS